MNYSKRVESFFNNQSNKNKGKDHLHPGMAGSLELKTFLDFLNLPPGSKLLDLGCGTGRYAIPLMYMGYNITGVDISRYSLDVLKSFAMKKGLSGGLEILENDFKEKVYEDVFNGAYCISTFHLLGKTPVEREQIFYNLFLATKKGGVILVMQPNPFNPLFYPFYIFHPDVSWTLEKTFIECHSIYMYNFFKKLGLRDIKIKRYGMLPTRLITKMPIINNINKFFCDLPLLQHFSLFFLIKGIKT